MKAIVVYYSLEGNTAYAAEKIAAALGADTLRLQPKKAYPSSGFQKFFWGGKSAVMAEKPALEPYDFRAEDYDCVILGFPVCYDRRREFVKTISPSMDILVSSNLERLLYYLTDGDCERVASLMADLSEKGLYTLDAALLDRLRETLILIDPKTKPSEENERRIEAFCAALRG